MTEASPRYRLTKGDLLKIGRGALIAGAGCTLGLLATELGNVDQSTFLGAILATAGSVFVNLVRKWLTEVK